MIAYVINPGSTSTKLALATILPSSNPATPGQLGVTLERLEIFHPDLTGDVFDHLAMLQEQIAQAVAHWPKPDAVVGRGGLLGPMSAGTYHVSADLAKFSVSSPFGRHASNLGAGLALDLAAPLGVPAYIVDPPTVDELVPESRIAGFPDVHRQSRFHALNSRAVARKAAYEVGSRFQDAVIVVAHLGGGSSITCFKKGRAIDTTGALLDEGPFSPQRAGTLPTGALLELMYEAKMPRETLERKLTKEGGFKGLLGTANLKEIEALEDSGDPKVAEVVAAFIHQVVKNIGAYSAVGGRPDVIALTGGVARWSSLMDRIDERISWIAPVVIFPGELELEALAEGAGRVLLGLEEAKVWRKPY